MYNLTLNKIFCVFIIFAWTFILTAQKSDSLIKILDSHKREDTNKVNLLYKIGFYAQKESDHSKSLEYLNRSARLARSLNYGIAEGIAYNRMGLVYQEIDEIDKARESINKGLEIFKSLKALFQVAISYNNLGNLEETAGNYTRSLSHFFNYLEHAEKLNSLSDIAIAYNNIGIVYSDMDDYKKELAYNFKALKIREKLNDSVQLAASYNNIGVCYQYVDNYEAAISYFNKALSIRKQFDDRKEIAAVTHNLAICYKYKGDLKLAEKFYLEALEIQKQLNFSSDIALTSINLGRFYLDAANYSKSFMYLNNALELTKEKNLIGYQTDAHRALSEAYESVRKTAPALFHFKKFIELRDSINNVEKSKEFTRIEMQNKFDREKAISQSNQAKKDAIAKQQQKQQRIITISVTALLLIITVFLFFVYRSYRQKQEANITITNQKKEVENQKHLVEEKQKEIIDSINYAQRIQSAILAREEDIKKYFPNSFLLYKPKDIVAGDFYFFEITATHVFYAAADCTGHGVPGALVSVVCSNALSRCVKEFGLTDPGKILDKTRDLVLETFRKSGQDVKDGMDISLLVKELSPCKYFWSGANNPLWYIQGNAESNEKILHEITASKQSIGLTDSPAPFTTHAVQLKANDQVFLFTDGFADQFGGPRGKKFKYKQLESLLLSLNDREPETLKNLLNKAFDEWKNKLEQVDDVLLIGIKV